LAGSTEAHPMSSEHWPLVTLGDLLEPVKRPVRLEPEERYETLGIRWYGNGPFAKPALPGTDIAAETLNQVRAGDIAYSKLFAWKGSFGTIPRALDGVLASSEFPIYVPSDGRLLPDFYKVWASRPDLWDEADLASTGTTANSRNRLATEDFLDFELALPPTAVQQSIVDTIEIVDRSLAASERRAAAARATFQALALDLFDRLDCDWKRLGDVSELCSGGTPSRKAPGNFGGSIPWVKTGEVRFNRLTDTEEHITEQGLRTSSAKLLPVGTVLLAMYGQGATRGRCALLDQEMTSNQACAAILPSDVLLPEYTFFFLWSRYAAIRAESEGSAQDNLNQGQVADIDSPLPGLDAQREIVGILRTVQDAVTAHDSHTRAIRTFRQALIDDLVAGFRLPPPPADSDAPR
jgi:type I restriction enzyme, S subunit